MSKDEEQSHLSKALGIKRQGSFITLPSPMSSAKGATISTEPAELTEEEIEDKMARRERIQKNVVIAIFSVSCVMVIVYGLSMLTYISTAREERRALAEDRKANIAAWKEACDNGPRSACVDYAQLKYPTNTHCGY